MSTFTKEQLIARINQVTSINNYRISRDPDADGLAMDNELFAIALASLEAEPIYQLWDEGYYDTEMETYGAVLKAGGRGRIVYSAPPAPVVPAELHPDTQKLVIDFCTALAEKLYKAQLKYGYDADWKQDGWPTQCQAHFHQHIAKGDPRDVAAYCAFMWHHGWKTEPAPAPVVPAYDQILESLDSDVRINILENEHVSQASRATYDVMRAAMLQGAEPVTAAYKLPFEQWLSQQTGTIDVECGCVMTEVFFHWLRVAYEAGNSPVVPDGWVMVPVEPTEDMIVNGFESEPDKFFSDAEVWEAYDAMSGCQQAAHRAKLCWAAMIAAAPQQEVKP